jgi:hypothetical protein
MLNPEFRLGGRVHSALPQGVTIRPATVADCVSLAPRLRKEDAEEAYAASGKFPEQALRASLGKDTSVVTIGGTPEMIFGCPRVDEITGSPWMLGTPVVISPKWRTAFLRTTRIAVEAWQDQYPLLHNFIDARNTAHMRWLRWLDFHFIARNDHHGPLGLPFYEFVRIKSCVPPKHSLAPRSS